MTNQNQTNASSTLCEEVLNLIPAYAFGATDPEETRFVEKHLGDCPEALAELSIYTDVRDEMLFESPQVAAPPALASRIAAIPKKPPLEVLPSVRVEKSKPRTLNLAPVAAAAAVLLLVVSNLYWLLQVNDLQRVQEEMLAALRRGDVVETLLISTESGSTEPRGSVLWSPGQRVALLRVDNLPIPPQDKEYQLWLLHDSGRFSAGTFRVNEEGVGVMVFEPGEAIESFTAMGITLEPAGGSAAPTSDPVLTGEI
jgi:hypothetical protein